jgi:osmotically-inducible protein OsmY
MNGARSRRTRRGGVLALGLFVAAVGAALPFVSSSAARIAAAGRPSGGPSDSWLNTTAKIAILTSIGTRGNTVQVDTMNGTMTLYGKVASPAEKTNAERMARSVEGVREVRSFLMIAPVAEDNATATLDSALQSEVAVALIAAGLEDESFVSGSNVSVQSVDKGTVLLAGTANSLAAHLRAIETARKVQGVNAVRSNIRSPDARAVTSARFLGR